MTRPTAKRVRNVQIVAFSREARVFRKLTRRTGGPGGSVAYACMVRSGPITRLKGSAFGGGQMRPLLAGRYVAFQQMLSENEDHEESGLIVLDNDHRPRAAADRRSGGVPVRAASELRPPDRVLEVDRRR